MHDYFKSYYRYTHLTHAECNDHIDRQLKAVNEILKHEWAQKLRSFLFDADKRKKELMDKGEYFSEQEIKDYFTSPDSLKYWIWVMPNISRLLNGRRESSGSMKKMLTQTPRICE